MTSQFADMTSSSNFLGIFLFLLSSLFTGPSFMSISSLVLVLWLMTSFFYKRLTRNPEIGNTTIWVFPNIWRLGWVKNSKSGTNVSYEMLLNSAKCQRYSFYRFWVVKGKPTGGERGVRLGLRLRLVLRLFDNFKLGAELLQIIGVNRHILPLGFF